MSMALLLAFLFLLFLPSARTHVFDGLPLSGIPEFAAFLLIGPLIVSGALRRASTRGLRRLRVAKLPIAAIAAALVMLAICAKLLLLWTGERPGFAACYLRGAATVTDSAPRTCERSYENLLFRRGMTRFDDAISFVPATWNLSFFNSLRLNYYYEKGAIFRTRMPFDARWRGEIDRPAPATVTVSYVGEGVLRIDGVPATALPPSYQRAQTVTVTVPDGRRAFALDFRFDDGSRFSDGKDILRGPYASLDVRAGGATLRATPPPLMWRVIGGFVDLTVILVLSGVVWLYGRLLRRDVYLVAIACVGGALLAIDPTVHMMVNPFLGAFRPEVVSGVPSGIGLTLLAGTLFVSIARRPSTRLLLLAYLALGWASAFRQDFFLRGYHTVHYQLGGEDFLTYESYARSILETGSLEAGESIFYYQPFFRYVVFLSHALFGDGHTLSALFAHALLIWSVFWLFAKVLPKGRASGSWRVMGIAVGLLLVTLVISEPVSRLLYFGASEAPTWTAFLLMFPCLTVSRWRRDWWMGTILLGLAVITRMNQALGLGWTYALFLWRTAAARPRFAVLATMVLGAIAALPTAHNVYYGGAMSVIPAEHAVQDTIPMPPSRWLRISEDREARQQALSHVAALTYTTRLPVGSAFVPTEATHVVMLIACRGLQLSWVLAAIALFTARTGLMPRLLLILPALFLSPHLFYQALAYHPRFIVIGYLSMGAVALLAIHERKQPGDEAATR